MISIAIPTYGRGQILLDTLAGLFALDPRADEILVMDQTEAHPVAIEAALEELSTSGRIRYFRLPSPSIPAAMNAALEKARGEVVLFVDDDVTAERGLVATHIASHQETGAAVIAGRVIQPWQEGIDYSNATTFHFATTKGAWVDTFIGCNVSIRRDCAHEIGGFDENFVRVAYNFEDEFSFRLHMAGFRIYFEPRACLHHLKIPSGGTRTFGEHLTTISPDHAVGAYYFILRTWNWRHGIQSLLFRPARSIVTRHHLRRPWWIPLTLLAELRGFFWAMELHLKGPRYGLHSIPNGVTP